MLSSLNARIYIIFFKAGSYFVNLSLIHVSLEEDKMFYVVNITERIEFK